MKENKSRPSPRLMNTCNRCRARKQKCDQRLPKCSACEKANAECVSYDKVAKRNVPRSYVTHLEDRVAQLEIALAGSSPPSAATNGACSRHSLTTTSHTTAAVNAAATTTATATISSRDEEDARLLLSANDVNGADITKLTAAKLYYLAKPAAVPSILSGNEVLTHIIFASDPFPSYDVAESLALAYFDQDYVRIPLIDKETYMRQMLMFSQQKQHPSLLDRFVLLMILAIGLMVTDPTQVSTCNMYYKRALSYFEFLKENTGKLERLEIILLMAQFTMLQPIGTYAWHLVGFALRIITDSGLHLSTRGTLEGPTRERRILWSTYSLDRALAIRLGRPLGIPDSVITLSPLLPDDPYTRILQLRQIQSRIMTLLYECTTPYPHYSTLNNSIQYELQEFLSQPPPSSLPHPSSLITMLEYHLTQLTLARPSPGNPQPNSAQLESIRQHSSQIIKIVEELYRGKGANYSIHTVYPLHSAATLLLYSAWRMTSTDKSAIQEYIEIAQSILRELTGVVPAAAIASKEISSMYQGAILGVGDDVFDHIHQNFRRLELEYR